MRQVVRLPELYQDTFSKCFLCSFADFIHFSFINSSQFTLPLHPVQFIFHPLHTSSAPCTVHIPPSSHFPCTLYSSYSTQFTLPLHPVQFISHPVHTSPAPCTVHIPPSSHFPCTLYSSYSTQFTLPLHPVQFIFHLVHTSPAPCTVYIPLSSTFRPHMNTPVHHHSSTKTAHTGHQMF